MGVGLAVGMFDEVKRMIGEEENRGSSGKPQGQRSSIVSITSGTSQGEHMEQSIAYRWGQHQ